MGSEGRTGQAVIAGSLGTVIGVIVMFLVNETLWWIGGLVGGVAVASLWMRREIENAVFLVARTAVADKMYMPMVWHMLVAMSHAPVGIPMRIRTMTAVGRWQLVGTLEALALLSLTSIPVFLLVLSRQGIGQTGLWGQYVLFWMIYTLVLSVLTSAIVAVPPRDEDKLTVAFIRSRMLLMTVVGILPLILYSLYKVRGKIRGTAVELWQFSRQFFPAFIRLIYGQALLRSMATGFMGVAIAHFVLVGALGLQAGPTLLLSGITGGLLGYFLLPEPARRIAQQ